VAVDADANRAPTHLPKTEVGRLERAPESFQPDVTEATASAAENMMIPIIISEAGQRNARNV
jgi:hypothetical protein